MYKFKHYDFQIILINKVYSIEWISRDRMLLKHKKCFLKVKLNILSNFVNTGM